ncbi:MAG TPA: tetratricopeptide repeat protein [Anaerolineales bacterium]|nr:tetratricopeptide repeat protein [Anaerolineales bacterium]
MKQWLRWAVLFGLLAVAAAMTPFGLALSYQVRGGLLLEQVSRDLLPDGAWENCELTANVTVNSQRQLFDAIDHLNSALKVNPTLAHAHLLLGRAYCLLGDTQNAINAYLTYTNQRPSNPLGHLELGFAYQASGDSTATVSAWQAAGLGVGDFLEVGDTMTRVQQFNKAIVWYNRALSIQPGLADAWYALGLTNQRQSQWQAAVDAYSAALEANVWQSIQVGDVYYRLGQIYQNASEYQDLEKALEMYAAALDSGVFSLEAAQADIYYKRGEIFTWLGRSPEECIAQFRQALLLDPGHFWAHLRLGQALYQASGEVEPAVFEVQQAIDNWPAAQNQVLPYQVLGDIYRDAGMIAEAVTAYKDALQIDPQNEVVQQRLEELGEK